MRATTAALISLALATTTSGCAEPPPAAPMVDEHDWVVQPLEDLEQKLRFDVTLRRVRGERADHGSDPIAVVVRNKDVAVLLRGEDRVQFVDGAVFPTDPFPSALVVAEGRLLAASSVTGRLQDVEQNTFVDVRGVDGVTALAAGAGVVDVADVEGDVLTVRGGEVIGRCPVGLGVTSLVRLPRHLVALSSLHHRVVVFPLDRGAPDCANALVERFDGPLFSLVAEEGAGGVTVIVSGIEDHPLDRSRGGFASVDSFVSSLTFTFSFPALHGDRPLVEADVRRNWEINVADHGVINGVAMHKSGDELRVIGKGSGTMAVIDARQGRVLGVVEDRPGVVAMTTKGSLLVTTNVIDDVVTVGGAVHKFAATADERVLLGEKLVFTNAMAPKGRFTCETCHLGGGTDGRLHNTGRVDAEGHAVTATTKPLFGLFQNPPLFTRALDRSVGVMVHAEFKVANRNTGHDPWSNVVLDEGIYEPRAAREAVVSYFASFDPPPNARAYGRSAFDDDEARGFLLFQQRCMACHAPRLFADDAGSTYDAEASVWSGFVVWGRAGHEDTGVRPKVHADGARPSSLRRVSTKTPLLTSGKAADLDELVRQVRVVGDRVTHEGEAGAAFTSAERADLVAFLRLL